MTGDIFVNEIYGPVFQGEGLSLGRPCWFLRLAGCNLACKWCDSAYTWDWKRFNKELEVHRQKTSEVIRILHEAKINRLVITGGEPMLQAIQVQTISESLHRDGIFIEIETAGTIPLLNYDLADQYNVSPKLSHSGNAPGAALNREALLSFANSGRANFKFVVSEVDDLDEVDEIVKALDLKRVLIMPEGITAEAILQRTNDLALHVVKRGYILTTRLHTLLYGARRGV